MVVVVYQVPQTFLEVRMEPTKEAAGLLLLWVCHWMLVAQETGHSQ
jgi:hypothetical protein